MNKLLIFGIGIAIGAIATYALTSKHPALSRHMQGFLNESRRNNADESPEHRRKRMLRRAEYYANGHEDYE